MGPVRLQLLAALALVGIPACSGDTGSGQVDLQLTVRPMTPAMSSAQISTSSQGQAAIALGGDEIVVDQVDLVLRKIKLADASGCPAESSATEAETGSEDCGEFKAGPVLFDLPLGEGVTGSLAVTVPVGRYQRIQFQIHRPTDNVRDAEFLTEHPDLEGTSIRVTGTYRGAGDAAPRPFTYTSDLTAVYEVELSEPIEVTDGGVLSVTLGIDLSGWFVNAEGDGLVDPADTSHSAEILVKQNIGASFHAFRDADQNGVED